MPNWRSGGLHIGIRCTTVDERQWCLKCVEHFFEGGWLRGLPLFLLSASDPTPQARHHRRRWAGSALPHPVGLQPQAAAATARRAPDEEVPAVRSRAQRWRSRILHRSTRCVSVRSLKNEGDAGEGTRWISSPKAWQWCSRQTHFLVGPKSSSMRLNA